MSGLRSVAVVLGLYLRPTRVTAAVRTHPESARP